MPASLPRTWPALRRMYRERFGTLGVAELVGRRLIGSKQ